jgi:NodT family efflux transporter outer membrane factor (OMF) lipoprotein
MRGERPIRDRFAVRALATAALAAFITLSCASVPRRGDVPAFVPDTFSPSGMEVLPDRWWRSIGDTTLTRLVEQALSDNLTLKGAYARLAQAEATARRDGAARFPSIDVQGAATQTERSGSTGSAPAGPEGTTLSAGAAASYELDLWGRVRSLSKAADLDRQGSREDLKAAAMSLSAQVALTYYQLVEQVAQLDLLTRQLRLNEEVLELVTFRFRQGQVGASDVLRQRQLTASTQGEASLARSRKAGQEHALAILLGLPPSDGELETWARAFPSLPPSPAAGVPADLVRRRPDTRKAYMALLAADRRVAAAVAARFPRISLSAQTSTSGEDVDALFNTWVTNLAANLMMPLFDAGNRAAEADRRKAMAAEKLYAYKQTVLVSLGEVEDALVQEERQREYLGYLQSQLDMSGEVVRRTRDSYASGASTYLQVLDALRTNQQLERTVLSARRQLVAARVNLCRALGGGWEITGAETRS